MLSLASGTRTRLKSLGLYGLRWLTSGHRRLSLSKLGPLAGAKEVVLTIGLSFKHAQPWKEPPMAGSACSVIYLLQMRPGRAPRALQAAALRPGDRAPRAVTASFRCPDADSCAGQQFPAEVKASAAQGHRPPGHPRPGET